jgi:hypothetical protein
MAQTPSIRHSTGANTVREPGLERVGKRLGHSAKWFLAVATPFLIVGVVLVLIGSTWAVAFGALAIFLALIPGSVGIGLLASALVSRWSARHKSFA